MENQLQRTLSHWLLAMFVCSLTLETSGCQQQMADQPSFKSLEPSDFFDDGLSARPTVAGTVARGHLQIDTSLYLGRSELADENPVKAALKESPSAPEKTAGGFDESRAFVNEFPIPINESVIQYGYQRYMIYCVVCHDPLGTGRGKIVERGYTSPPSYHIQRLRESPVGRLFAVVSEGYGSMPSYAAQIPPEDRWAIVAYVRALQLSQHFAVDDLTPDMRSQLDANADAPERQLNPSKEDLR